MILFIFFAILFLVLVGQANNKAYKELMEKDLKNLVKQCPPHNWQYAIVNGVSRLKCATCLVLPGEATYNPRGNGGSL